MPVTSSIPLSSEWRGFQVEGFIHADTKERVHQLKLLHAEMPQAQQDFICLLGYSRVCTLCQIVYLFKTGAGPSQGVTSLE